MNRRRLGLAAAALCLPMFAATAQPAFPSKPVRIVVGLGPGSSLDLVARAISPPLSQIWGQPVVVENRTGAAGNLGADAVARSDDGHTLLLAQNALAISASLYPSLPYNLRKNLKAVTEVTSMPHVIIVGTQVPAKTLGEFIALAKAKPGEINFGSAGVGNADHLAAELLSDQAGIRMIHVPYTSGAQALNATMAGDVQLYFPGLPVSLPMIKAGRVRALAVTGASRSPALPDVPTVKEAGLPNYRTELWYGLFAPSTMSDATVQKIARDVAAALRTPEMKKTLDIAGIDAVGNSPAEFSAFVDSEVERWGKVIKERHLRAE